MVMTTAPASGRPILAPEDVDALLVLPALEASVAGQVCRVVRTASHTFRVPRVAEDPAASWTEEGSEIAVSDAVLDEVVITPTKVAGLSIITNELAADSSPEAAAEVGAGLARDIARRIDEALFGAQAAPAPAGLASLTGVSVVTGLFGEPNDLDPFAEAASVVEQQGASVGYWVANPADALRLAQFKTADGGRLPLLAVDPTQPARRIIEGRPLLVSAAVAEGTVWGIPTERVLLVVRQDADVVADSSPFFTSDRTAVRATMRAGLGYVHEAAIVKITTTPADPAA